MTVDRVEAGSDVTAVRHLSRVLFGGAQYRLEVAAAIARSDGIVNAADLAHELSLAAQSVHKEIQLLERAGLVARTDRAGGRRVYFTRLESPYWIFCGEAYRDAEAMLERGPRW